MNDLRPLPEQPVPDNVLAELHAAFVEPAEEVSVGEPDGVADRPSDDAAADEQPADEGPADEEPAAEKTALTKTSAEEKTAVDENGDENAAELPRRIVVIDDGEQLADTVYLADDTLATLAAGARGADADDDDAATGDRAGRATIVIDHLDDHPDAVPARTVSVSIDPRLRARRAAVDRAVGRRRLLWAGVAAAVLLVAVAVVAILASTIFDVRNVTVQSEYTDKALISHIVEELRGTPILRVDTRKYEGELEASPWVESAKVTTHFPHDVTIDIRERHPQAAFVGSDQQWRVIDRDGRVLAVLGSRPLAYMPLTGASPDLDAGQFAGPAYAGAAQLVIALPPEIRQITSSVGVDAATGQLGLALDAPDATGVEVRLGTVAGMEDKLARLLTFVRQGLKPGQKLDVSTADVAT